jgi:hypothetical protein
MTILVLGVVAMSVLYMTGLQALKAQSDRAEQDSAMRSSMEQLISLNFSSLQSGTANVTIAGKVTPITWTVTNVDLSGDLVPESDAKLVVVTLLGRSLTMIVVDNKGKVGKIS